MASIFGRLAVLMVASLGLAHADDDLGSITGWKRDPTLLRPAIGAPAQPFPRSQLPSSAPILETQKDFFRFKGNGGRDWWVFRLDVKSSRDRKSNVTDSGIKAPCVQLGSMGMGNGCVAR